jgi:integrase
MGVSIMPKKIVPLTDTQIRQSKPKDKDYKLADGDGLYLLVTPSGGKLWRLKYRFDNKEKLLTLGAYPAVTLSGARKSRDDAKVLLANGQDPGAVKKAIKEAAAVSAAVDANTFERIAREWFAKNEPVWSTGHTATVKTRLEKDVFTQIGSKPIATVTASDVRELLLRVEARGAVDTALRIKIICGQVFRYAVAHGHLEHDPSAALKPCEIFQKREVKHHAAITEPKELAPLLRDIDDYHGTFIIKCALKLAPMLFVRPGELRKMEWSEIDLDAGLWSLPANKMKTRQQHLVPLAQQAVSILKELHQLTGSGKYAFPGRTSSRPMSENSINAALRYLGYDRDTMTGHGFRAVARTILDEVLKFRVDIIEHQLAHAVRDANGRAYNRTSFLDDRRKMMQVWSDYLDNLKMGAKVIPLQKAA